MRAMRLVAAAIGCALTLSLGGCGYQQSASVFRAHDDPALRAHTVGTGQASEQDPTVGQLWNAFQTSLVSAKTMHITGTLHVDKRLAKVDMSGACDNSNGRSSITMDDENFEVTAVGGTYYIKANTAYWKAAGLPSNVIVTLGSRYLSTTDPTMGQFTVGSFVASLKTTEAISDGMGVIAEKTTLTGRPVYLFSVRTGEDRMTIWVTDTAYTLLKIRMESTDGTDELSFSEWNVPVNYTAPPPAQIVKI
jgi:hypothetical protein